MKPVLSVSRRRPSEYTPTTNGVVPGFITAGSSSISTEVSADFCGGTTMLCAHDLQLALEVLQLELDGDLAGGLVHHADGVEVAEVAVGHLLEQGALGAQQGGLHVGAREEEEAQQAPQAPAG